MAVHGIFFLMNFGFEGLRCLLACVGSPCDGNQAAGQKKKSCRTRDWIFYMKTHFIPRPKEYKNFKFQPSLSDKCMCVRIEGGLYFISKCSFVPGNSCQRQAMYTRHYGTLPLGYQLKYHFFQKSVPRAQTRAVFPLSFGASLSPSLPGHTF